MRQPCRVRGDLLGPQDQKGPGGEGGTQWVTDPFPVLPGEVGVWGQEGMPEGSRMLPQD